MSGDCSRQAGNVAVLRDFFWCLLGPSQNKHRVPAQNIFRRTCGSIARANVQTDIFSCIYYVLTNFQQSGNILYKRKNTVSFLRRLTESRPGKAAQLVGLTRLARFCRSLSTWEIIESPDRHCRLVFMPVWSFNFEPGTIRNVGSI